MVAPETARDFVYVDDVLDALLGFDRLAAVSGEVFNLGSGVQSTMRDVVSTVLAATASRSPVQWGTMPARRWDSSRWQADITKARRLLHWAPTHALADGIASMAAWMDVAGARYASA
jgi:nucleoside-diphosphate-sugar epimerase